MVASEARVRALASEDCAAALDAARQLVDDGAQLPAAALEGLRRCIERERDAAQMTVTRVYLRLIAPDEAVAAAQELLHHRGEGVREAAYDALIERGPAALPAVEALSADRHRDVRWFAYQAASHWGDTRAIPLLIRGLRDEDFSIRWLSANGLIELEQPALVPLIEALAVEEPTTTFHAAALRVLRRVPYPAGLDADVRRLADSLAHQTTTEQSVPIARAIMDRLRD